MVEQPNLDISSTKIRNLCKEGKPFHHLYDESTFAVADYIKKWNLWRDFKDPREEEPKLREFGLPKPKKPKKVRISDFYVEADGDEVKKDEAEKEREKSAKTEEEKEKEKDKEICTVLERKEEDESVGHGRDVCVDGAYYGEVPLCPSDLTAENLSGMLAANGNCIGKIKSFKSQR